MGALGRYKGKKVLITGHTGFTGAWLCVWLTQLGARVIGFSLPKWPNDRLYRECGLARRVRGERGDVRDLARLGRVFTRHRPEIVFHLAAQPLVLDSYQKPVATFESNVLGTANVLECMRRSKGRVVGVMVTTDKCYKETRTPRRYREQDELGGQDPYSSSKAAAEVVLEAYRRSYLSPSRKWVASARAGNLIGGGDRSKGRILPDCVRALESGRAVLMRDPSAVRPWQHVIEATYGYLLLGSRLLAGDPSCARAWNFGPGSRAGVPVSELVERVIHHWGKGRSRGRRVRAGAPHEAKYLGLDASMARRRLGWRTRWSTDQAVRSTVEWYKGSARRGAYRMCVEQVRRYRAEVGA